MYIPPLVLKVGAPEWFYLLHYIGVPEQALGWLPLGLGLGWLLRIDLLNFHIHVATVDVYVMVNTFGQLTFGTPPRVRSRFGLSEGNLSKLHKL